MQDLKQVKMKQMFLLKKIQPKKLVIPTIFLLVLYNNLNNKENTNANDKQNINIDKSPDVLKCSPKLKKRKMNETKELEQTFFSLSNKISNYIETSQQSCSQQSTLDDIFIEFIKAQLNNIPKHEKNLRRKMIMDGSTSLPKM